VLGGGSSINVMAWARGHRNDWDVFAAQAHDPAWSYESVLKIYRAIEDWHGAPDPKYRGTGGPVFVQPAPDPNPIAPAMVEGARSFGIPTFDSNNGRMMEGDGGASILDLRVRDGKRVSVFRTYTFPLMDRPNLTVLTHALVTRLTMKGKQATGVQLVHNGNVRQIGAGLEVVLSLGAMQTPKVLMLSELAIRLSYNASAYRSCNIFRVWGGTFRITLESAVSGSISIRSHPETTAARQRSSGRAIPVSSPQTYRPARPRCRSPAPRPPPGSILRRDRGRCSRVWCGPRATAGSV